MISVLLDNFIIKKGYSKNQMYWKWLLTLSWSVAFSVIQHMRQSEECRIAVWKWSDIYLISKL